MKRRGPYKIYTVDPSAAVPVSTKYARKLEHPVISPTNPSPETVADVISEATNTSDHDDGNTDIEYDSNVPAIHSPVASGSGSDCTELGVGVSVIAHTADSHGECAGVDSEAETGDDNSSSISSTPLYEGSRVDLATSTLLIQTFAMRHSLSEQALSDLLTLVELHCPLPNTFTANIAAFQSHFHAKDRDIVKCYFCTFCHLQGKRKVSDRQLLICKGCQREIGGNDRDSFLTVPLRAPLLTSLSGRPINDHHAIFAILYYIELIQFNNLYSKRVLMLTNDRTGVKARSRSTIISFNLHRILNTIFYDLQFAEGLAHILQYKENTIARRKKATDVIGDVVDGQLYSSVYINGHHFKDVVDETKELHITLQMNTDGVAIYKSSNQSAWPVFFTINELPPALRQEQ